MPAFPHADATPANATPACAFRPALLLGAAGLAACLAASLPGRASAQTLDDHQQATAALQGLQATIDQLVRIDSSYATDRDVYRQASQRAIELLDGKHAAASAAAPGAGNGTPADAQGAIGHISTLLDRKDSPVWTASLRGAQANMRAAVAYLHDSLRARELLDYEVAASRAITYLEVARGRSTETGVFGGLEGAIANTELGVPAGAKRADGCKPPSATSAYGVHDGYLAWMTVPGGDGLHSLPQAPGGTEIAVRAGSIVLYTAAAPLVSAACAHPTVAAAQPVTTPASPAAESAASQKPAQGASVTPPPPASQPPASQPPASQPPASQPPASQAQSAANATPAPSASSPPAAQPPQQASGPPPSLYTKAQAQEGAQLFAGKCVSCHGANLQGVAAPSVAGNDFLQTAQRNGWTLAVVRYLVVNNMPLNAPSSMSPKQYASVMAFLLASNCYPAGSTPFPTTADPAFANIKLQPVPNEHQEQGSRGVCKVD